jgi:hypothetical protein
MRFCGITDRIPEEKFSEAKISKDKRYKYLSLTLNELLAVFSQNFSFNNV